MTAGVGADRRELGSPAMDTSRQAVGSRRQLGSGQGIRSNVAEKGLSKMSGQKGDREVDREKR